MSRSDKIALFFSLLAIPLSYWIGGRFYEHMAHLEDEMAYVWQAQVMARGQISVPSPEYPNSFLFPFIVDYNGLRFGKYPPGWPALLAIGEILNVRDVVNPILAGLCIWLIYRLGKRVMGETVGVLAAGLTLVSPFFLVNAASLLSHPLGLALSATFALFWLQAFGSPPARRPWLATIGSALAMGGLILTRPYTAVGVAIPFALHGIYLLFKADWAVRRRLLAFVGLAGLVGALYFAWQYAVTGDPFLNPYVLWWPYDKIGFGPGHGHKPIGHTLEQAWINTKFSLSVGYWDLFGWPKISWIFIPFGVLAVLIKPAKRLEAILVSSVVVWLGVIYMAYWVGATLYGPRYYFEGFYSLAILSAAGVAWLAGWPIRPGEAWPAASRWQRARSLLITGILAGLVVFNLVFYLPARLEKMHGLYGVQRAALEPFLTDSAHELTPALVVVHPLKEWIEYGRLLELESPFLDSPFIFIYSRGAEQDQAQAAQFPERRVLHYYADQPNRFYLRPRNTQ